MEENQQAPRTFVSTFWNRVQLVFLWPFLIIFFALISIVIIPLIGIFGGDDMVEKTLHGIGKNKDKDKEE